MISEELLAPKYTYFKIQSAVNQHELHNECVTTLFAFSLIFGDHFKDVLAFGATSEKC